MALTRNTKRNTRMSASATMTSPAGKEHRPAALQGAPYMHLRESCPHQGGSLTVRMRQQHPLICELQNNALPVLPVCCWRWRAVPAMPAMRTHEEVHTQCQAVLGGHACAACEHSKQISGFSLLGFQGYDGRHH
jgi:hypothetical protein